MKLLKVSYTIHALKRMKERKIEPGDIMKCLKKPDKIEKDRFWWLSAGRKMKNILS